MFSSPLSYGLKDFGALDYKERGILLKKSYAVPPIGNLFFKCSILRSAWGKNNSRGKWGTLYFGEKYITVHKK